MAVSQISETIKIFFSYAPSGEDRSWFEKLHIHLSGLKRQGLIEIWYDSAISAGSNVGQIIETYLNTADIIVLLISADFLASDQCCEVEMKRALELSSKGAARIIPVLLRPSDWKELPLEQHRPLPPNGNPVSLWKNRDAALLEVAREIRKVVEELARSLSRRFVRSGRPQFPLCTVPHRQNPFFTDREDLLTALHTYFSTKSVSQTRIQAINGLSGMGKTQLAVEYACRYRHEYQAVLWLNATSHERLSADVASLADQLSLPTQDRTDEQRLFAAVKHWLHHHDQWLLLLDNLEDFTIVNQLIPPQGSGHVLLITHSQAIGTFGQTVSIIEMAPDESALLLLRRAKRIAEHASPDAANEAEYLQALSIAQEVAGYPLALDQAGAYIEETHHSLASYLELYRRRQATLLGMRGRLALEQNEHPDPVTTTLSLTFARVAQIDPHALELLRLFAFLHPDDIPDEMLTQGASALSEPLQTIAADPVLLDTAIATLRRFSLLHHRVDTTTLNIHRIVQVVLKAQLTNDQQRQLAIQVVHLVNHIFPGGDFLTWPECERYLPQAQRCAKLITDYQMTFDEAAHLLHCLGTYCYERALYSEAETSLTHALSIREQQRGPEHLETAETLNALAQLYSKQGKYRLAEPLYLRALSIREQQLGPDHVVTALSLNNLASLYRLLADYQRAATLQKQALTIYEHILGLNHSSTATALNNLALIYQKQGHYQQAEPLLLRALALREHAPDVHHLALTSSLNMLAELYQLQGKHQQAEPLLLRAIAIREQTLGSEHPDTARSLHHLAALYDTLENYPQAEALYQRTLSIYEQVLGSGHPRTAGVLHNLAFLFRRQGQYQRAEPFYQRALVIYEQTLGPDHPRTANTLNSLGRLYRLLEHDERAEPLLRRALAIRERVLGSEHIETSGTLNVLAELLTHQGHYEQAEPLFQRALAIRRNILGEMHPEVALVLENYIKLLERTHRAEEARAFQQIVQSIKEKEARKFSSQDHE